MTSALIGHSGFVGSTLKRQRGFEHQFRSSDIAGIDGGAFETVVCAGAPAQKWKANADPDADRRTIDGLIEHLDRVTSERFVLISTVDVFGDPTGVDESSVVRTDGLHAYGANRRRLEEFVQERFDRHLVVRLPGLVGPGLRKNVIFDLLHDNNLDAVDSRGVFQFYPMVNLWWDIDSALGAGLSLVHLTAEPVDVATVARLGFGRPFENHLARPVARYDFRTRHADVVRGTGDYHYSAADTIMAVRSYAQSAAAAAEPAS
ncbi:NAD-dependent epimerase/dehydratase family protein [Nocardioides xinjiangensis]|uniref:hypothetical protein n=1 Tax=Nocardioides xinjiangensis TaxID=2817376 RepID=UPI001B304CC5|nr:MULTISPECIES: hypothetical protein [unclassified Nocardioides]